MSIRQFLQDQSYLLLDGGISSEIQRRGVSMHPLAWSAVAHWQHPDIVEQMHLDYLQSGARVLTANSFHCARHILETIDLEDQTIAINARAVEVARHARERSGHDQTLIAGSLSTIPPLGDPGDLPRGRQAQANYAEQAMALAEAGVDVLICEMLMDSETALMLIEAANATGLPVWAGLSASERDAALVAFRTPGKYLAMADEPFEQLVENVAGTDVEVMGVMHTKPPLMSRALKVLRNRWRGPAMAYAEIGSFTDDEWRFDDAESPEQYAELVLSWIETFDLKITGGCCGTSPRHIAALASRLK